MSIKKIRTQYKRKREGKTNYKKRLKLLQSRTTRLVIRKSNKHIIAQLTNYYPDGDKVVVGVNSKELEKIGWKHSGKNTPAAYLTGLLLGKKALAAKVKEAILDLGLQTSIKKSKVYATLKGTSDMGLNIHMGEDIVPDQDRIEGKHIDSKTITKDFEAVKNKIMK